jgi:hypothetical protein
MGTTSCHPRGLGVDVKQCVRGHDLISENLTAWYKCKACQLMYAYKSRWNADWDEQMMRDKADYYFERIEGRITE